MYSATAPAVGSGVAAAAAAKSSLPLAPLESATLRRKKQQQQQHQQLVRQASIPIGGRSPSAIATLSALKEPSPPPPPLPPTNNLSTSAATFPDLLNHRRSLPPPSPAVGSRRSLPSSFAPAPSTLDPIGGVQEASVPPATHYTHNPLPSSLRRHHSDSLGPAPTRIPPVKDAALFAPSPPCKEVAASGSDGEERRRTTPPDLLELSHMYFDRQQHARYGADYVQRVSESAHSNRPAEASPTGDLERRPATSDNEGLDAASAGRPRRLAPLSRQPDVEEARIKIDDRKKSHGLHLSVNYTRQGWRQALNPIESPTTTTTAGEDRTAPERDAMSSKKSKLRRNTFVIASPEAKMDMAAGEEHTISESVDE